MFLKDTSFETGVVAAACRSLSLKVLAWVPNSNIMFIHTDDGNCTTFMIHKGYGQEVEKKKISINLMFFYSVAFCVLLDDAHFVSVGVDVFPKGIVHSSFTHLLLKTLLMEALVTFFIILSS